MATRRLIWFKNMYPDTCFLLTPKDSATYTQFVAEVECFMFETFPCEEITY